MTELTVDRPTPPSALAIGAHPDDVEFQCGATLAKWADDGCVVHHLVLTDGSRGSWDAGTDRAALVETRRAEQRAAAKALGATGEVVFLDHPDGELDPDPSTRLEIVAVLRRLRPAVVLGHDPWKRYRLHPDHRHAGWLTLDAVASAREALYRPDVGDTPHRPDALLLFEADEPSHAEDVTDHVDRKLAALLEHRSQYRSTMHIDDPSDPAAVDAFRRRITDRLADGGRAAGVTAAELFADVGGV